MEQRQLNFAEKSVQVLTLEELEKSYHENLTTGEPVGGIYHFALIHDGAPYPLNSGQINETAEQLIALFSGYRTQSPCAPDAISYWDAYQRLNTVLKPDRMDIPQVLPQSLALFETLKEMIK